MERKVLITGAAGFIGFHAAKALQANGVQVLGLDNFNPYYSPKLKKDRVKSSPGLTVLEMDLNDASLKSLIKEFTPTHILHLAAQAGVRACFDDPSPYIHSNIQGFMNILEAIKNNPEIKLVYASSSSVYGLNEKEPFSEADRTENQASFYGVTKKCNELMAKTYHHLYGIQSVGLRFFTVYGPWGRPDMAYYHFADCILNDKPISLYNYGHMKRDFTYIDDIIQGTLRALDVELECDLFNLGNHEPVALNRFIDILEDALGKKAIRELKPMQKGDVLNTYADISKAKKILGFQPKTSLEKGLVLFADWFKGYHIHRNEFKN